MLMHHLPHEVQVKGLAEGFEHVELLQESFLTIGFLRAEKPDAESKNLATR